MWNSRKEFRDWIKSLDSSSIIANRILCEDKLGLFKDYSKSTRMWMTRVMNDALLTKGYDFAVYKQ